MLIPWRYASVTFSAPQLRGMPIQLSAVQFSATLLRMVLTGPWCSYYGLLCLFGPCRRAITRLQLI